MSALGDVRTFNDFVLSGNTELFVDVVKKIDVPEIVFEEHEVTTSNGKMKVRRPKLANALDLSMEFHYIPRNLQVLLALDDAVVWQATGGLLSPKNASDIIQVSVIFRGHVKSDKQGAWTRGESEIPRDLTLSLVDYSLIYFESGSNVPFIHFAGSVLGGPLTYMNKPLNIDYNNAIGLTNG